MNKILLIGDGLLATHIEFLLTKHNYDWLKWKRSDGLEKLERLSTQVDTIFLCISDDSIIDFYNTSLIQFNKTIFHFSGSVYHEMLIGIHPMMTFSSELYSSEDYEKIVWMCDRDIEPSIRFIQNIKFIKPSQKSFYHALCVTSGNVSQILWSESLKGFEQLGLTKGEIVFYLQKNLDNFNKLESSLTGPIVRKDKATIERNLTSLELSPLKGFYNEALKVMENTNE